MNNAKQLKIGAVLSYVSIAVNILAGLLYTPWMVHQIGDSAYGLYTLANSLIGLFLVDFGLSSATSRFVAKFRAQHKEDKIEELLTTIYGLYAALDVIIFVTLAVVYCFIDVIYQNLTPVEIVQFKVVYCIAGTYSLINFPCMTFNGILNAYEKFIPLKLADVIYRISVVLVTVIAISLDGGLYALVVANAFCGLLSIGFKYIFVAKSVKIKIRLKNLNKEYLKDIFKFSIWTTVCALAQRLIFNITPTILGIVDVNASSSIAVFGIVVTIEGYVYLITTAINGMFLSKISRLLIADNRREELTKLMTLVGRFQYAVNGIVVVGFALVGREFILLWMGESFVDAYMGIVLVLLPGLFYNSLQIAQTAFIAQNLVKYQAYIQLVVGIINVVLSLVLSGLFGVIGAAVSICIAYFIRTVLTLFLAHRKLDVDLKYYIIHCYLKMSVPIIATLAVSLPIILLFDGVSWLNLVIKGLIIASVFLLATFVAGITKSERQKLLNIIKRN